MEMHQKINFLQRDKQLSQPNRSGKLGAFCTEESREFPSFSKVPSPFMHQDKLCENRMGPGGFLPLLTNLLGPLGCILGTLAAIEKEGFSFKFYGFGALSAAYENATTNLLAASSLLLASPSP
jgi:hypothetical protein